MANVKKNLKNNVQKYRIWKGIKQFELAEKTGISVAEIRLIERNKVTPTPRNLASICNCFGVSQNQMFFKEEDKNADFM